MQRVACTAQATEATVEYTIRFLGTDLFYCLLVLWYKALPFEL